MRKLLCEFWCDERGCVPAGEWVFVASVLTLGTIAGLLALHYSEDTALLNPPAASSR